MSGPHVHLGAPASYLYPKILIIVPWLKNSCFQWFFLFYTENNGPYLFYIEKFITQFKATEKNLIGHSQYSFLRKWLFSSMARSSQNHANHAWNYAVLRNDFKLTGNLIPWFHSVFLSVGDQDFKLSRTRANPENHSLWADNLDF